LRRTDHDRLTYIDLHWLHLGAGTRGHSSEFRQRLNGSDPSRCKHRQQYQPTIP
jgi:hypothetical protein